MKLPLPLLVLNELEHEPLEPPEFITLLFETIPDIALHFDPLLKVSANPPP